MKSKQLVLVSALGAVLITVAWFFLLWSPASAKVEKAKVDKQAAEQRQSELQARLGRLKKLEANADVLERDRVALSAAIPDSDNLDEFLHQVNERASTSGVSLVSIAPTPPAVAPVAGGAASSGASSPSVGLQMQVNGDYFAVMRFLEALRDGPRLITVDNLTMAKGGDGNAPLSATIAGKMFVAPPPATAPSATPIQTASA